MTQYITKKRSVIIAAALLVIAAPGVAFARGGVEEQGRGFAQAETTDEQAEVVNGRRNSQPSSRTSIEERGQAARERAQAKSENIKARLEGAQKKKCEVREQAIRNIIARISERGNRQVSVFDTIAVRVMAFKEDKGIDVEGYDELVDAVEDARPGAHDAVDELQAATEVEFECEGDNPRAVAEGFKEPLKEQIAALKTYRTAVKDLIVAVKTAHNAETTESDEQTETDTPEEGAQE